MSSSHTLKSIDLGCERSGHVLFADISFEISAGQFLLVQGSNGAGKSSLIRILAGLATPAHGQLYWHGKSIQNTATVFSKQLHYIGHENGLKSGLTVCENLALFCQLQNLPAQTIPARIETALAQMDLAQHRDTISKYLSAGQQRRAALARLFLTRKTLWLLDEPLTALDQPSQSLFLSALEIHLSEGGMCIMSSHQPIGLVTNNAAILRLSA